MTSSWHHRPCYDVIGFPYIRRRAWPMKDLLHLGLRVHLTLVWGSTARYSCTLGLTLWCVPASWAYFLQLYLIGLLLLWASPRALTPRNAPTHPMSVISSTSCAVYTGPTSFRLVPVSTIPAVQVYIFGSVLPLGWHIVLPCGTHHNFGVPGWAQLIENGPIRGKYSTLAEIQVCKCVVGQEEERYALLYQES